MWEALEVFRSMVRSCEEHSGRCVFRKTVLGFLAVFVQRAFVIVPTVSQAKHHVEISKAHDERDKQCEITVNDGCHALFTHGLAAEACDSLAMRRHESIVRNPNRRPDI